MAVTRGIVPIHTSALKDPQTLADVFRAHGVELPGWLRNSKDLVSRFDLVSPTDFRYSVPELDRYFSEESFVRHKARVEVALVRVLARRKLISARAADLISTASRRVTASETYEIEEKTKHDIIALVRAIQSHIPNVEGREEAVAAVHRTATSYDIVNTANALRIRNAFRQVIIPDLIKLEGAWLKTLMEHKETLQVGRTHTQWAEPVTFGFVLAWYADRLGRRILQLRSAVNALEGKFSGAVGTHGAASLFVPDPAKFEAEILGVLGVKPARITTQIVPPEQQVDLMHATVSALGVIAGWAQDMYHLQRPEIGEVGQPRGDDVSASSTMPFKTNPVGLENIMSVFKYLLPRTIPGYLNQLSLHQRDLTNSAVERFDPEAFVLFDYSVRRALRVTKSLKPHAAQMRAIFDRSAGQIIGEPLHLLLAANGYQTSHETVGRLADKARETGRPLMELVRADPELQQFIERFTPGQIALMSDPSRYIGIAPRKAENIARYWANKLRIEL